MMEERRRFFRIDDSMGIAYRPVGQEEAKAFALQTQEHGSNFDFAANFDNRIQTLLDACKIQSPLAAELVDLMNKKLNFIIRQMDMDTELMHKVATTLRQVNVSACGMAFATDDKFKKGQTLHLDIVLQPSELHIALLAEVVECQALEDQGETDGDRKNYLRLNFTAINFDDQELLIQHIVKRQSSILKQRRREQQA